MHRFIEQQLVKTVIVTSSLVLALGIQCHSTSAATISSENLIGMSTQKPINYTGQILAMNDGDGSGQNSHSDDGDEAEHDDDGGNVPVPEPGTLLLLSAGAFGLAVYGKRRGDKVASFHGQQ
jgi:hypothetical protein